MTRYRAGLPTLWWLPLIVLTTLAVVFFTISIGNSNDISNEQSARIDSNARVIKAIHATNIEACVKRNLIAAALKSAIEQSTSQGAGFDQAVFDRIQARAQAGDGLAQDLLDLLKSSTSQSRQNLDALAAQGRAITLEDCSKVP